MSNELRSRSLGIGLAIALLSAIFSLFVGPLSVISAQPFIGALQIAAMWLVMPGLFGSAILSANVHDSNLAVASLLNFLLYFGLVWLSRIIWLRTIGRGRPHR